jgi:hypothetical protein
VLEVKSLNLPSQRIVPAMAELTRKAHTWRMFTGICREKIGIDKMKLNEELCGAVLRKKEGEYIVSSN